MELRIMRYIEQLQLSVMAAAVLPTCGVRNYQPLSMVVT